MERISARMARRIALAAQGIGRARPATPGRRHVLGMVERLGALQIDSVNVLVRAHYMPGFSRLGAYPRAALDALAWGDGRRRALFEYWGHEASLLPFAAQPLFRWRMERAERGDGMWRGIARFAAENKAAVQAALAEIAANGAMAAADLTDGGKSQGSWWGWSDGKKALEYLFWSGRLAVAGRGAAISSASTTCPSACCPPMSSPRPRRVRRMRIAPWSASPPARSGSAPPAISRAISVSARRRTSASRNSSRRAS